MNDWFEWNGVRCTQYGIHVSELPPPTIPSERVTYTNVPGRPGSLTTLEGEDVYEDVVLTAQCFLADPMKIPAIAAWLKGSGKVAFAGLDVVSTEPIRADNPLLKAKNCIITPHMSWGSQGSRQRIMDTTAENVKSFLAGSPVNVVNR